MTATVHEDKTMPDPIAYEPPSGPPVPETPDPVAYPIDGHAPAKTDPAYLRVAWKDDPAIALLNQVVGEIVAPVAKGGLGGYITVTEAERPNPDPDGDPIQGANVSVVVPSAEAANRARSQLNAEFSGITIEEDPNRGGDAVLFLWVPGPHGRVGHYTNKKCRDLLCQTAWSQKNLADKAKRRARLEADPDLVEHGKESTRVNYGCTCEPCKAAHAAAAHRRKQKRRLAKILTDLKDMGGNVTAEPGGDAGETIVYAVLPTTDDAAVVYRRVVESWANSQRQGFQVSFIVDTHLAVSLGLIPETDLANAG